MRRWILRIWREALAELCRQLWIALFQLFAVFRPFLAARLGRLLDGAGRHLVGGLFRFFFPSLHGHVSKALKLSVTIVLFHNRHQSFGVFQSVFKDGEAI